MVELIRKELHEIYREYDWVIDGPDHRIYRIDHPKELYYRAGGETHRIVDENGVVHCVPAPGFHGCALRWVSNKDRPDVEF